MCVFGCEHRIWAAWQLQQQQPFLIEIRSNSIHGGAKLTFANHQYGRHYFRLFFFILFCVALISINLMAPYGQCERKILLEGWKWPGLRTPNLFFEQLSKVTFGRRWSSNLLQQIPSFRNFAVSSKFAPPTFLEYSIFEQLKRMESYALKPINC